MKITKLVHSCLIVEKDSKKILVDPGVYSWQDETVRNFDFSDISAVVVTHIHPDHLNEEFVSAVYKASPSAKWYGTNEAVNALNDMGIQGSSFSDNDDIRFVESAHADLSPWFDQQPEHTSYLLFGDVLVSGDCHTLSDTHGARILAAAINGGPWGAVIGFAKMIEQMDKRPEVVVPIHDWHWNEKARAAFYSQLPDVLGKFNVKFEALETGVSKDIL